MKILVTGAAGLLGRAVVEELLPAKPPGAPNRHVVFTTDASPDAGLPNYTRANLLRYNEAQDVVKGVDAVIHLAGTRASVAQQTSLGWDLLCKNLQIDMNVFRAMRERTGPTGGITRGVYASTVSVYPERDRAAVEEDADGFPAESVRYSAWGKLTAERLLQAWQAQEDHHVATVRLVNTYGPHDNFDIATALVVPALIRRVLETKGPLVMNGYSEAERDLLYAEDAARGIVAALEAKTHDTYNLGRGTGIKLRTILETIVYACDRPNLGVTWAEASGAVPSGAKKKIANPLRAFNELDWRPRVPFVEGVKKTVEWYRGSL